MSGFLDSEKSDLDKLYYEISIYKDKDFNYESYTIKLSNLRDALNRAEELKEIAYQNEITSIVINEFYNEEVDEIWSWCFSTEESSDDESYNREESISDDESIN